MEKYCQLGTKISPSMAVVLDKICDTLGVDVYHLLQMCVYAIVRASSPQHELSPEVKMLMAMLETDAGWQEAFNLCNPDGLEVSQMVLILEQKGKKGFGAVMVDKPFMGQPTQTECVDDIVERMLEVCMHGIYRRLRRLAVSMDCSHLSDLLLTMVDRVATEFGDEIDRVEMKGQSNYNERGKEIAYGKRSKIIQTRTPDGEAARQQRIIFGRYDAETADRESGATERGAYPEPFGTQE